MTSAMPTAMSEHSSDRRSAVSTSVDGDLGGEVAPVDVDEQPDQRQRR